MGHWAEIDDNNVVKRVLVIKEAELDTGNWGDKANWVKTSYNTHLGKHYNPKKHQNWSEESADQSKALRYRFAGIGCWYDSENDVFFTSPQPYPSWVKDMDNYTWKEPIPIPLLTEEEHEAGKYYVWDEDAYQADNTKGWVLTS